MSSTDYDYKVLDEDYETLIFSKHLPNLHLVVFKIKRSRKYITPTSRKYTTIKKNKKKKTQSLLPKQTPALIIVIQRYAQTQSQYTQT